MSSSATRIAEDTQAPAAPGRRRRGAATGRAGLAAAAGVLLYLSFPPRPLWWLAVPAFALLGHVLYGRRPRAAFGLGLLAGLGFLLPLLVWTGEEVGPVPWLALTLVEALFVAAGGVGIALVTRLPLWPVWAAAVWVAAEGVRARWPFGGFSWGKIAFGQADGVFIPLAAAGGTPLVGFAVALCGFGLYAVLRTLRTARPGAAAAPLRPAATAAAALAVLVPVAGALAARPLLHSGAEDGTATAAVIQGNVPRAGFDFNAQRRAVLDNHARRTEQLADDVKAGRVPRPDFVVWPENSSDLDPYTSPDAYEVIDRAVKAIGVPVSIGAVLAPQTGPLRNTQILWDPVKGPTATYDKRQIQPFGEYIPMRSVARMFSSDVDRVRRDFGPGDKPGVFDMAGTGVGLVTCYEAAFDGRVRDTVRAGAQVISVPSNNATFGRSQMTYQQLAMDRVRAVEHSRTVLVPVTSGVSAVIRPDGTVVRQTAMFEPAALVEQVPLRSSLTPATRLGALPEYMLFVLAAAPLGWVLYGAARARRRMAPEAP
ncbi:apolipoprotein N-acyltransferase [Streptomyces bambusae]|uniref:apolipoprotein N-acyltransferase n=1 Tax=Streptomyces bambusae TaxID=1550616 RepID=UPI001CFD6F9B|nr:apolipoprotein N-acyltransferase [Streptomyces bambusae]MCB5166722.1 apolipoprotein N-acyltransferase [Streptomyces bambusae]